MRLKCGGSHALFGTSSGKVFSYGKNCHFGQLGLGDVENAQEITEISNLEHKIERISCGKEHSLLLSQEGKVFSFGRNDRGQLGLGDLDHRHVPTQILSLDEIPIIEMSAGGEHSICISGKSEFLI